MTKRLLQLVLLLIAAFMFVGCMTPYKEPTSGPRAKVRFAMLSEKAVGKTWVFGYPHNDCTDLTSITTLAPFAKGALVKKHKSLDIPLNPATRFGKSASTELYFPAGKRYSVEMDWNDGGDPTYHYCNVTTSFIPQADRMYEVLDLIGKGRCGIAVLDIVQDGTGKFVTRKDASQRRGRQCGK